MFNAFTADVATGLSTCITKDGQTVVTANIPFAGFYATNIGIRAINGTVGVPGIAFNNDTSSGFYRIGAQNVGLAINGVMVQDINASRLLMVENLLFTDATYDIGTSASVSVTGRPRDLWLSRNLNVFGDANVAGGTSVSTLRAAMRIETAGACSVSSFVASDVSGNIVATQAQMEAGLSNNVFVPPGRQHFHPGMLKAWVCQEGGGSPSNTANYNVSSITDNGTGDFTHNFSITFSSSSYSAVCTTWDSGVGAVNRVSMSSGGKSTTSVRWLVYNNAELAADPNGIQAMYAGDL